MTRSEAWRAIVSKPREVPDDGRIGHRVIHAEPDWVKVHIPRHWRDRASDWYAKYAPDHRKEEVA